MQGVPDLGAQLAGVECLVCADIDAAEAKHQSLFGHYGRTELQDEVEDVEEVERGLLRFRRQRLHEIDGGRRLRCLSEENGERSCLIAGLDLLHGIEVLRTEQLRAIHRERKLRLAPNDLGDAGRGGSAPIRARDQEIASAVAGGAAADIREVEGVRVDELDAEVAVLLDRRDGQHHRLGTQVEADHGVGRIGIGRLHRHVRRGINAGRVMDDIPIAFVLGVRLIDVVGVLYAIAVDQREAVDVGLLGELARTSRRDQVRSFGGDGGCKGQRRKACSECPTCDHGSRSLIDEAIPYRGGSRRN